MGGTASHFGKVADIGAEFPPDCRPVDFARYVVAVFVCGEQYSLEDGVAQDNGLFHCSSYLVFDTIIHEYGYEVKYFAETFAIISAMW